MSSVDKAGYRDYTVYAASAEEAGEGWIWFSNPDFRTRTLIRVEGPDKTRSIRCEARTLDQNFVNRYNAKRSGDPQMALADLADAVFMSEWYRNALGGFATTRRSGKTVRLRITRASVPWFCDLRAACDHPSVSVRLGVRLGVLGVWLGGIALTPVVLDEFAINAAHGAESERHILLLAIALLTALLCYWLCRGVRRLQ
jgi:hypothetical protein